MDSLVYHYLEKVGLGYAWPTFEAAGIVTPSALANLDATVFEALGVHEAEDRRKLFYLIQRVKMEVKKDGTHEKVDTAALAVDQMLAETSRTIAEAPSTTNSNSNPQQAPQSKNGALDTEHVKKEKRAVADKGARHTDSKAEVQEARIALARKVTSPQRKPLSHPSPLSPTRAAGNNAAPSSRKSPRPKSPRPKSPQSKSPQPTSPQPTRSEQPVVRATQQPKLQSKHQPKHQSKHQSTQAPAAGMVLSPRKAGTVAPSTTSQTSRIGQQPKTNNNSNKGRTSLLQPSATKSRLPVKSNVKATATQNDITAKSENLLEKDEENDVLEVLKDDKDIHDVVEEKTKKEETSSSPDAVARRTRSAHSKGETVSAKRQSGGLVTPRSNRTDARTRLKTPAPTANNNTPASKPATAATSRIAKAQPKSNRTGKALSAIPADRILPMSPLIEINTKTNPEESTANEKSGTGKRRPLERRLSSGSLHSAGSKNRRRRKSGIPTHDSSEHSDSELSDHSTRSGRSQRSSSSRNSLGGGRPSKIGGSTNRRESFGVTGRRESFKQDKRKASGFPKQLHQRDNSDPNSFKFQIEDIRDEQTEKHEELVKNDSFEEEEDMRIRVVIRKRPMSTAEVEIAGDVDVIHPLDYRAYGRVLVYQPKTRVDLTKEIDTVPFSFDNVFDEASSNQQIYERSVRGLIPPLFDGQWGCVFAYGQTGSGKTYTMMGSSMTTNSHETTKNFNNLGLYYMAALDIFHTLRTKGYEEFSVGVSLFEIYGGKLFDLLNDRHQIKCLEDHKGKVRFPGLSEHALNSAEELIDVIDHGAGNRSTGSTSRNADSSRSHAVLQLHIYKARPGRRNARNGPTEFSRLTFIDLAGSERGADTSTANRETRMEGAEINTSLLALKEVIRALATGDSMTHVPFRGSKLTQVLKESFVGANCRSVMIACVSPNIVNVEQTLNTLRYANRVKERNPENGQVSGAVAAMKPPKRDTKAPLSRLHPSHLNRVNSGRLETEVDKDFDEEEDSAVPFSPSKVGLRRNQSDVESTTSFNSNMLDEILADTEPDPAGQAAQQVMLTHKETMTSLMEMLKEESQTHLLLNSGEIGMEDYIAAVNDIQQHQLKNLALVRERIQEYQCLRQDGAVDRNQGIVEDEYEDLRDC